MIGKNQAADSEPQDELITWMEGAYAEVERVVAVNKDRERKICMEWEQVVSQQSRATDELRSEGIPICAVCEERK